MKKLLLMNGPNLNLLGVREPAVYGTTTLADVEERVRAYAAERGTEVDCFQSNHEGALIDRLHAARGVYDGIVYNPGAHTHYSYALRDAVSSIDVPCVEVHISDIDTREEFRRVSVIAPVCVAQIKGKGVAGYEEAVDVLLGL
ncbi:type II 3-dehydroquinate dehydratase [Arabiibacter massiliensis]|uniref:type II 3-dehydroquinate dehydratase n=1 Tax=Arabiibacter massiliensis TaxID=1870985 RepID=UPI0009BB63BC|nr:type II 3-dehydroquinate dehydratase [Arabiibacter massiliensis]